MPSWRTKDGKKVSESVARAIEDLYFNEGCRDPKVVEKKLKVKGVDSPGTTVIKSVLADANELCGNPGAF